MATRKQPAATPGPQASQLISQRIAGPGDWRDKTLARMRKLIQQADPARLFNSSLDGNVRAIDIHEGSEEEVEVLRESRWNT